VYLEITILSILVVWLTAVTYFLYSIQKQFRYLTKGVKRGNLLEVLSSAVKREKKNRENILTVRKSVKALSSEFDYTIKKVGLVRFNPFKELGGDQSFSLAMLDGRDTGIILTGLHSRERTRMYVKEINKGKCQLELSNEEKKALGKAIKEI